jgi:hypothetical protein
LSGNARQYPDGDDGAKSSGKLGPGHDALAFANNQLIVEELGIADCL